MATRTERQRTKYKEGKSIVATCADCNEPSIKKASQQRQDIGKGNKSS